jgi:hypothetical protein
VAQVVELALQAQSPEFKKKKKRWGLVGNTLATGVLFLNGIWAVFVDPNLIL